MKPSSFWAWSMVFAMGSALAQPGGVPPGANISCAAGPTLIGNAPDTVSAAPDAEGFVSIFDGKSLKGWWESCQGLDGEGSTTGGIWLVDTTLKALFSNQATSGAGSVLMTNKSYTNYEIQFDFWPDFGNDGGIFHRTNAQGRCYQTVLDYITGGSMGGVWGENGYANLDIRPYTFGGNENTINYGSGTYRWTYAGIWANAWNANGWNQIRSEVCGNPPRVRTYQRRPGDANWIPVLDHTSTVSNQPSGYVGFQIHIGAGRWSGRAGNWYRGIKVRPLTSQCATVSLNPNRKVSQDIRAEGHVLIGTVDGDYDILVRNVQGKVVEKFSGSAGPFRHAFTTFHRGLLLVEIKTAHGVDRLRLLRISG